MQGKTRFELYQAFVEFIANDLQTERRRINRKMFSVFLWCFLMPVAIIFVILLLVKFRLVPRSFRSYLDWLILVLPVIYSLYVLGSEVLVQVPEAFRKGGLATTLGQAVKEGQWRNSVSDSMERAVTANAEEWSWIIASFKMDLQMMLYRTRYLTALAGAVFFLLTQGIDTIADHEEKVITMRTSILTWAQNSAYDFSQNIALALFLVLLYLSGSQTYHTLSRYLNCAELVAKKYK